MRKTMKTALITVFFVLVALCFVGCGSGDSSTIGLFTKIYEDTSSSTNACVYCSDSKNEQHCAFYVWYENPGYKITIIYSKDINPEKVNWDAYDSARIEKMDDVDFEFYMKNDGDVWFKHKFASKSEVLEAIPSSGAIICHIDSSSNPKQNIAWKVPATNANHIRTWILNHE